MDIQAQATQYLETVVGGFVMRGVEIACDGSDVGLAFSVIPKVADDYRILIGFKGKNCSLMRAIMKLWGKEHAPNMSIHVFVPNPRLITNA